MIKNADADNYIVSVFYCKKEKIANQREKVI